MNVHLLNIHAVALGLAPIEILLEVKLPDSIGSTNLFRQSQLGIKFLTLKPSLKKTHHPFLHYSGD